MIEIIAGTLDKCSYIIIGLLWAILYATLTTIWTLGLFILPFIPLKYYDEKRIAQHKSITWINIIPAVLWIIIYWTVYISLTLTIVEKIGRGIK